MNKDRVIKIVKASLMLVFFVGTSILQFKRYDGHQLRKLDDADDGFKIGKLKVEIGAKAFGMCGSAYACAGGGGQCGSAYACTGR